VFSLIEILGPEGKHRTRAYPGAEPRPCSWATLGSQLKIKTVVIEKPANSSSELPKPMALTTGPKAHTDKELTAKDTPNRMPETRERKRSST
jgi:hypothetical protein